MASFSASSASNQLSWSIGLLPYRQSAGKPLVRQVRLVELTKSGITVWRPPQFAWLRLSF